MQLASTAKRLAVAGTLGLLAPGEASALTYYYVGGVYEISNFPIENRPLFTTGYMVIDESLIPEGEGLAGMRMETDRYVDVDYWGPNMPPSWLRSMTFQLGDTTVGYDANKPWYCDEYDGECYNDKLVMLDFRMDQSLADWYIADSPDGGESVFEKRHAARLTRVAMAAMVIRVSATAVSCS